MTKALQIGLIGLGNIGCGVLRTLAQNESLIGARLPRQVKITRIADLDTTTRRD
ncbi:homoserine dehydrogenase, partial [Candidatus Sumerlaeota bacterium]|nr:homoserine dehydrogenase [Candidatus Sumerlaeota bacterium]